MSEFMFNAHSFMAIFVGGIVGFVIAKLLIWLYYWMVRDTDKNRVKTAILKEQYYNDLYEEALSEEMDELAEKAARDMSRAGRRQY